MIVGLCWVGGWKIVFFFFAKLLWPLEREGICVKVLWEHFSLQHFPPDLGGWKLWAQKRKLSPGFFFLPIFLLLPNSGKYCFLSYFPSYVFYPPYFHPNQTQCKRKEDERKIKPKVNLNPSTKNPKSNLQQKTQTLNLKIQPSTKNPSTQTQIITVVVIVCLNGPFWKGESVFQHQ